MPFSGPDFSIPVLQIMVAAKTYQADTTPKMVEELKDYEEEQQHRLSCFYQALATSPLPGAGDHFQALELVLESMLHIAFRQPEIELRQDGKLLRKHSELEDIPDMQVIFCLPQQLRQMITPGLIADMTLF